jgi:hypothetical protein
LLNQAISIDQGQPNEDMSVVVVRIISSFKNNIRRISVNIPFYGLN